MIKKIILIVLGSLLAVVAVIVILFYVKGPFVGFPGSRTADGSRAVSDGGVKICRLEWRGGSRGAKSRHEHQRCEDFAGR